MNRLTGVSQNGAILRNYSYDALGNRVKMEDLEKGLVCYEYDQLNRLTQMSGSDGVRTFDYDRRGNLISVLNEGEFEKGFTFNAANKMVSAITADGSTAAYTYDGFGRRVKSVWDKMGTSSQEPNHTDNQYVLDFLKPYENILMTYGGEKETRHIWGNELISANTGKTEPVYYLHDELRSPVRTIAANGNSLSHFSYDEFGIPATKESVSPDDGNMIPFGFTGYQLDPVTDLYFAQARYYAPQTGRFVSEDKYRGVKYAKQTLNYFTYCINNPLTYIDLSGNEEEEEEITGVTNTEGMIAHQQIQAYFNSMNNCCCQPDLSISC